MNKSKLIIWLRELRAPFFTASIIPVLVGAAVAYATKGVFDPILFSLALLAMVCLHAGANMANDYFDHLSRNDWINRNLTPFSGGSQLIQQDLLSPKAVLTAAWIALTIGAITGLVIVLLTKSVFLLALGLTGLLGGYFYTADPIRLGYRAAGELVIALLFGLLPVYGSYYLQTASFDLAPLFPGILIAILIFLVILINEFPDVQADREVNKKTLVVLFGDIIAARVYKTALLTGYVIAALAIAFLPDMTLPALFYLLTLPIAVIAIKFLKRDVLDKSGGYSVNQLTILLHLIAGLLLSMGFVISGL